MKMFRQEVLNAHRDRLNGEVVLSQPIPARALIAVVVVIIVVAITWVSLGTYTRIETVPGIIITDLPSVKLVSPRAGTTVKISVREGQLVDKGQALLMVDSDQRAAVGGSVTKRSLSVLESQKALSKTQKSLVEIRARGERSRLESVVSHSRNQAISLRHQIELQEQIVRSNGRMFDEIAEVVRRGFITRVEEEKRHQQLLNSEQRLADLNQQLAAQENEIQQAQSQIEAIKVQAEQSLAEIDDSLLGLSSAEAKLQGEQGFIMLAPIRGRVTAITSGSGTPVVPGKTLMTIVPEKATLSAELYAPSSAIGFVKPNDETRLLYDAFPYQRFGSFGGEVTSVSRTAIDPEEAGLPFDMNEPVYKIRVKLDNQTISAYGRATPLQPGMKLSANIVLERQNFLGWFLQPLNAVLKRNG